MTAYYGRETESPRHMRIILFSAGLNYGRTSSMA
jgi:hypothetical protein